MAFSRTGRFVLVTVALLAVGLLSREVKRSSNTDAADDLMLSEPSASTDADAATQVVSNSIAAAENHGQSFSDLEIRVRDAPLFEDPDVFAAFEGEQDRVYSTLISLAEDGNLAAYLGLYHILHGCRDAYKTESELEAGVADMHQLRRDPRSSPGNIHDDFNPGFTERQMRDEFARCEMVSDEAVAEREKWRQDAARSGYPPAMVDSARSIVDSNPDEALDVYTRYWELGGAGGAGGLMTMYRDGWEGVAPDLVRSAAYGYISTQFSINFFDSFDTPRAKVGFADARQAILEYQHGLLSSISPAEFDQAYELANELLEGNPNCCFH